MKVLKPYINIWVIATSHHLGPQKLAFFQGNPIISGKSRLVKYYTVIWPDGIFQQKIFQLFLVNVNFPTRPTRYPGAGSLQGADFSSLVQQGAENQKTRKLVQLVWPFWEKMGVWGWWDWHFRYGNFRLEFFFFFAGDFFIPSTMINQHEGTKSTCIGTMFNLVQIILSKSTLYLDFSSPILGG